MKNNLKFLLSIFTVFLLSSCSGGDSEDSTFINVPTPAPSTPQKTITLRTTTEIFPTSAIFRAAIVQQDGQGETPGFVYATTPNPTVINNASVTTIAQGSTNFEVKSGTLQPNTTYYVRAFIKTGEGLYTYSSESTFKTTGYFGPAGGYVAYDKGEAIDGWRYIEIHPTTINYSSAGVGGKWGDPGTFISGTYPDFGKGLENTNIIVAATTTANCAAKLCDNLVRGGYSDWFLPSSQELLTLTKELGKGNISISSSAWSSTQSDANSAYTTHYSTLISPAAIIITTNTKGMADNVFPARRY
ncbi:hypothetical protein [Chryseobacterium sp.]|uniref:hypothetical protein n=1 Tax=Chryseobacterium sp. TaxID=1871047 RepID=UPI002FCAF053